MHVRVIDAPVRARVPEDRQPGFVLPHTLLPLIAALLGGQVPSEVYLRGFRRGQVVVGCHLRRVSLAGEAPQEVAEVDVGVALGRLVGDRDGRAREDLLDDQGVDDSSG